MSLIRGDSIHLPLAAGSVDLIVTSPPYFALRSYTDDGEHYDGQIGSEATPSNFIDALVEVTRECVRVLKPSGSLWVNLGDKYAGSGGGNQSGMLAHRNPAIQAVHDDTQARNVNGMDSPRRYNQSSDGVRQKSLMGLPWRYAIRCIDDLGLILRAEVIWSKPNGLPESVTDRVRRSHEQWFHFTLEPRYYSAVDEIREPQDSLDRRQGGPNGRSAAETLAGGRSHLPHLDTLALNPLGKLPGSVWIIPTEPLVVPDHLPQHFAAFPSEWPRRIVLGWSPSGVCRECGEGRRPVVDKELAIRNDRAWGDKFAGAKSEHQHNRMGTDEPLGSTVATITGYACACPSPDAPTRPAVVLDPFAGTGTTVAVANALGRHGVGVDLSADYLKLARWRCSDPGLRAKALQVEKPPAQLPGQESLFG